MLCLKEKKKKFFEDIKRNSDDKVSLGFQKYLIGSFTEEFESN